MKEWIKALLILPFNVIVVIPVLILCFSNFKYQIPPIWQLIVGGMFLVVGFSLAVWTMILFHKIGKGTLAPWAATKHLVVEGPFKYVRNPMITGVLFILLSEAIILNTINIFYWMLIFFLINCVYFKLCEEKRLEHDFGQEYIEYRNKVPMWFPRLFNFNK